MKRAISHLTLSPALELIIEYESFSFRWWWLPESWALYIFDRRINRKLNRYAEQLALKAKQSQELQIIKS